MRATRTSVAILAACVALAVGAHRAATDLSRGDEVRALYSDRFAFTDDGIPVVTVEIMGGQDRVALRADGGLVALPSGDGGPSVAGADRWLIEAEGATPPRIREWTVVAEFDGADDAGAARELDRWRARGHETRAFEVGTVFGVDGAVIDGRRRLVAIDPVPAGKGAKRARRIARRYGVHTRVHEELVDPPRGTIVARAVGGRTVVRSPGVLWFAPARAGATVEVADVVYGGGGSQVGAERTEDRSYYGSVYVTIGRDGKLVAVNAVPADKLLAGLVPAEIFPDAPDEALAAQAVAARTELLSRIGTRHFADPFLVCSSQHCQVYAGAGREHPRTTRAVDRTRGLVLLRDGGGLVDARYSASCGGHGEHNEHIWGGAPDPALRGAVDATPAGASAMAPFADGVSEAELDAFLALPDDAAYCGATRYGKGRFRWRVRLSADDLTARVAARYPGVGRVVALEPVDRGVSGRIRTLAIRGDRGTATVTGDLAIRRLLGGLKSSLFRVTPEGPAAAPAAFVIDGAGFGHGVGMCQTGAIGRAEAGQTFRAILEHYYPGSRVRRLY